MDNSITISPQTEKLIKRAKIKRNIIMFFLITGIIIIALSILSSYIPFGDMTEQINDIILPVSAAGFLSALLFGIILRISTFRSSQKIIPEIHYDVIPQIIPDAFYNHKNGFSRDEIISSGIFNFHFETRTKSNGMISGIYRGLDFRKADFSITRNGFFTPERKEFHFIGTLYTVKCESLKQQTGRVLIAGKLPRMYAELAAYHVSCTSGDNEFDSHFKILADDHYAAANLLTPKRIEYIKSMLSISPEIFICFNCIKGEMHIMLTDHRFSIKDPYPFIIPSPDTISRNILKQLNILKYSIDELLF